MRLSEHPDSDVWTKFALEGKDSSIGSLGASNSYANEIFVSL